MKDAHDDDTLKQALRALPPLAPAAELDALGARVLVQWRERHADAAPQAPAQRHAWRRRLWLGTAGLAAVAAVATALLVSQPDPALDELMQPDVLSQMAIGEM